MVSQISRAPIADSRSCRSAVVSSALDTSVGMAGGLALAACMPSLHYACGLGTVRLLGGDVVANPVAPEAGWLDVARHLGGGVGPAADPELVERWRVLDREDWWRERMLARAAV